MSHHRRHRQRTSAAKQPKPKQRFRLSWRLVWRLLLPIRACFWGLNWFRWANTKFPKPPEDGESGIAAALQTTAIAALYFIAYAFYGSKQVTSLDTLVGNFVASFSPASLLNVAIFVMGLFVFYAYLLRVSARQLWAPLACIALPLGIATATFTLQYTRWHMVPDPRLGDQETLLWFITAWVCLASAAGFVYILYRAIKTRLNAYLMHPVLTPLIELTLAAKALDVSVAGHGTRLWLPYVPGRALVVALPGLVVMYYLNQTFVAHRQFLATYNNTTTRQLTWCWQQFRQAGLLVGLWRTSTTATFRLGVAIALLLVVTILFPANFADVDVFK